MILWSNNDVFKPFAWHIIPILFWAVISKQYGNSENWIKGVENKIKVAHPWHYPVWHLGVSMLLTVFDIQKNREARFYQKYWWKDHKQFTAYDGKVLLNRHLNFQQDFLIRHGTRQVNWVVHPLLPRVVERKGKCNEQCRIHQNRIGWKATIQ